MSSNLYDAQNNQLIPYAGSATVGTMRGASATTDGLEGSVPRPLAGDQDKFLRGDGSWVRSSITVDSALSTKSENPVQNKVITNEINKSYKSDDDTETSIDDADYIPFYDTSAQTKKKILKPDLVGKVLTAQTLAIGATTLTFTDSSIGNNSRIRVISNPFTAGLINAVQNGNTVTLTFDVQEVALNVILEVRN